MRRTFGRPALVRASVSLLLCCGGPAAARDAGAPRALAAGAQSAAEPRVAQLRALLDGSLDVSVSPQSLFDVPLDDDAAIEVEATRIRTLLHVADQAASAARGGPDAGALRAELAAADPARWGQRLALDRARLDFYSLDPARRAELLRAHAARQATARPGETEAELRARQAKVEREQALEAARAARSEAERLVAEELARLIALESQVSARHDQIRAERDELALRRDVVLGWQRRTRDARALGSERADATYDALRRALSSARDELSVALSAVEEGRTNIPVLGPDPLVAVPPDIATDAARERRAAVARAIAEAQHDQLALREERAAALLDEVSTLNRERLSLLPDLTPDKRDAITGLTAAGWDQASSEARHLALILRYHQHVALSWLRSLRGGTGAVTAWRMAVVVVPSLVAIMAFLWARRRTPALLRLAEQRQAASDRADNRTAPSTARRVLRVLRKIHRPLEWMLFFLAVLWLLPSGARELLELQLLASVIGWSLAGALIVSTIDAFAAGSTGLLVPLEEDASGRLRLRSLRLVGRTIVALGLVLMLTARLVGEGTIYSWVIATCWFAALPIFLLLVRWWRGTVFERLDRVRKKTPLQSWILQNRAGWKSFLAAMLGALQLFGAGAIKLFVGWLSQFELARRIHAYLFRRELERMGEGQAQHELAPLPDSVLEQLHPERPHRRWLACPGDRVLEALVRRASERRGGLIAVVGARGMGKSSLLRAASEQVGEAPLLECTDDAAAAPMRAALGGAGRTGPRMILLDDAHRLIQPSIGGFARFDEIVAVARGEGQRVLWVLAIDAALWPLLKRARDARPLFDETHVLSPWKEGQIGALLADRCEHASVSPTYDDLLDRLPPGADEIDRQDALAAKRAGYERMLWDHVGGNPALALEVWRSSLARDERGVVHVRPLSVKDVSVLENLPDSSLFVLRAVLQLAPTTTDAVAQATRLRPEDVLQDLRFGKAQGFFDETAGRVRVAWPWLRAVSRLLERRHLLTS